MVWQRLPHLAFVRFLGSLESPFTTKSVPIFGDPFVPCEETVGLTMLTKCTF